MNPEIIKKAAFTCCLFFIHSMLFAQDRFDLSAVVKDAETMEIIPFLKIELGPDSVFFSDVDGLIWLPNISLMDTLHFFGMGYDRFLEVRGIADESTIFLRQGAYELSGIKVTGFRNQSRNISSSAAIGVINSAVLSSNDQTSLQNALNLIPGVSMESRGYGGSQRINIRGSFLRSPFAVRNVKMYIEGIPLSSPDGSSPLELMDSFDLGRVEVIKGQGGSLYGSGTGGVLIFSSPLKADDSKMNIQHNYTSGAFGLKRSATAFQVKVKNTRLRLSHVYQDTDGYRIQEFNRKQQLTLMMQGNDSKDKSKFFAYATYFNGHLGLPGSLNAAQVEDDPQQANVFSAANNASLYRERIMVGLSGELPINDAWKFSSAIYGYYTNKFNPFGTSVVNNGFKEEKALGFGVRAVASRPLMKTKASLWNMSLGYEGQHENFEITESSNDGGLPGSFKYRYDVGYESRVLFAQTDYTFKNAVVLEAGISYNYLAHEVEGNNASAFSYDTTLNVDAEFLPRFGMSIRLLQDIWLHGSLAAGISNPTVFEQVDAVENTYNINLRPELGLNKEIGIKGNLAKTKLQFEVSAYQFNLSNAIVGYNDSIFNSELGEYEDILRYRNAGNTIQKGIEAVLRRSWKFKSRFMNGVELGLGFTATDYTFGEYELEGLSANTKQLPGVMKNSLMSNLVLTAFYERIIFNLNHYWNDRSPLNNSNTSWSESYHLLNGRLDINLIQSGDKNFVVGTYIGINNLLDARYTSFLQVNAPFNRFYNPSPERNIYFGFVLKMPLAD